MSIRDEIGHNAVTRRIVDSIQLSVRILSQFQGIGDICIARGGDIASLESGNDLAEKREIPLVDIFSAEQTKARNGLGIAGRIHQYRRQESQ